MSMYRMQVFQTWLGEGAKPDRELRVLIYSRKLRHICYHGPDNCPGDVMHIHECVASVVLSHILQRVVSV